MSTASSPGSGPIAPILLATGQRRASHTETRFHPAGTLVERLLARPASPRAKLLTKANLWLPRFAGRIRAVAFSRTIALLLLTAAPALCQRVTDVAQVRIDGRLQRVRKINGRWWSDDNRQLTKPKGVC